MRHQTLKLCVLLCAGLFTGCALTTLRSVHRTPDFRASSIRHVLVIGHFENQTNRKIFEEEFVRQWSRRGVQAESSLAVLPSSTTLNKANVAPIAKARGFDTVLVSRLLERKTIRPGEPAVPSIEPSSQSDMKDLLESLVGSSGFYKRVRPSDGRNQPLRCGVRTPPLVRLDRDRSHEKNPEADPALRQTHPQASLRDPLSMAGILAPLDDKLHLCLKTANIERFRPVSSVG